MTHTVTLISDHLGSTRPRVMGSEYVVDASIDITSYTANGETITASSSCVVVSGISTDTIAGGYAVSMISAEVASGAADGGKYQQGANRNEFQIHAPAASNTDNIGEIRVRVWGLL